MIGKSVSNSVLDGWLGALYQWDGEVKVSAAFLLEHSFAAEGGVGAAVVIPCPRGMGRMRRLLPAAHQHHPPLSSLSALTSHRTCRTLSAPRINGIAASLTHPPTHPSFTHLPTHPLPTHPSFTHRPPTHPQDLLDPVRASINGIAAGWSREEKDACLQATPGTFTWGGQLVQLITEGRPMGGH